MKIGTLTVPFASQPLKDVLPYLHGLGVKAVELGTSRVTNSAHCNPDVFLGNPDKIKELKQLLEENDMVISALSCHGNPIHPDKKIAAADHKAFVDTVALAQELGVDTIVEIGPGKALIGFVKKTAPAIKTYAVETCADLDALSAALKG